ncbi:hypothetical protein PGT21_017370 [Puccinia graminis f. sp. tritici]|uniref:Uncharacterized protein n=1 Tax=Puccinia graminis f. sp. tritici TaxID=56615 RepID=A0A5B0LLQ8_PUCGR|nr:hypothetical protein PGT21_017370 [Puccinia graminis f. sp. tritici]
MISIINESDNCLRYRRSLNQRIPEKFKALSKSNLMVLDTHEDLDHLSGCSPKLSSVSQFFLVNPKNATDEESDAASIANIAVDPSKIQ